MQKIELLAPVGLWSFVLVAIVTLLVKLIEEHVKIVKFFYKREAIESFQVYSPSVPRVNYDFLTVLRFEQGVPIPRVKSDRQHRPFSHTRQRRWDLEQ